LLPNNVRRFRAARLWSNRELKRFASECKGSVINVSAWADQDKEGKRYKDYFENCSEYWVTNWKSEACGFQGDLENEIYFDLESELPGELIKRFDTVFNHTTLEHVFDVFTAFSNICRMSKDTVIIVVPFMQEQHSNYGDYWRFTPQCIRKLFEKNGFELVYLNFNGDEKESIYIFAIGARSISDKKKIVEEPSNKMNLVASSVGASMFRSNVLIDFFAKCLHVISNVGAPKR